MEIVVNLTAEVFRRFSVFDVMRRRKVWKSPLLFFCIMGGSAVICYIMSHVRGAVLLGTVLMSIAMGLPVVYFSSYFASLRKQIIQMGLTRPQYAYTLTLTQKAQGIDISNAREHATYAWDQVHHVYRDMIATYLYMTPNRAFILPHTCIEEGPDELWKLISKKVPKEKQTIL